MKIQDGVPQTTISLVTETMWVIYEDGYVTFGDLPNFDEWSSERLSHWIDWLGGEKFPQTEEEIVEVLARSIE
jgi:hypothetical protein